jgi:hypothetical protein
MPYYFKPFVQKRPTNAIKYFMKKAKKIAGSELKELIPPITPVAPVVP